jgi:hypothetical protein
VIAAAGRIARSPRGRAAIAVAAVPAAALLALSPSGLSAPYEACSPRGSSMPMGRAATASAARRSGAIAASTASSALTGPK